MFRRAAATFVQVFSMRFLLLSVLFGTFLVGFARAADPVVTPPKADTLAARFDPACGGTLEDSQFEDIVRRGAAPMNVGRRANGSIELDGGSLPIEGPATLTLNVEKIVAAHEQPDLNYHAWARVGDVEKGPVQLPIHGVESHPGKHVDEITIGLGVETIDGRLRSRIAQHRYRILVVGCIDGTAVVNGVVARTVTHRARGWLFAGVLTVFAVVVVMMATWSAQGQNWLAKLFSDFRGRPSFSRLQLGIFTVVVAISVAYSFGRTGLLTPLSSDVLLLLGIVGGATVGAGAADVQKCRLHWDVYMWLRHQKKWITDAAPGPFRFGEFFTTVQGQFDVVRLQAFLFTVIVAATVAREGLGGLGTLEIPESILYVLGLSQVTYIGGKIVAPPTVKEFGDQAREIMKLEQKLVTDEKVLEEENRGLKQRELEIASLQLGLESSEQVLNQAQDDWEALCRLTKDLERRRRQYAKKQAVLAVDKKRLATSEEQLRSTFDEVFGSGWR